jgi:hypothetical protein
VVIILSATEQKLTSTQRQQIEARLSSYNIPVHILHIVADRCGCPLDSGANKKELPKKPKISTVLALLNDKAIAQLEQIFLDCHDSFSGLRFAVFLSSMYSPMMHKFVMDNKVVVKPGLEYSMDIGIYSRNTEKLVAVGVQNNEGPQPASIKSLRKFLASVKDLRALGISGAYYSSSYGYADGDPWKAVKKIYSTSDDSAEIRFFEYRDKIYSEIKSK